MKKEKNLFPFLIHSIGSIFCPSCWDVRASAVSQSSTSILSCKMTYRCQCLSGPRIQSSRLVSFETGRPLSLRISRLQDAAISGSP